jgi:hypothetical protein
MGASLDAVASATGDASVVAVGVMSEGVESEDELPDLLLPHATITTAMRQRETIIIKRFIT